MGNWTVKGSVTELLKTNKQKN